MVSDPVYIIGLDAGNSESNLAIAPGGRLRQTTIPSYIGSGTMMELARIRGGAAGKNLQLAADEFVLETDHQSYFVGRLALTQSADADSQRGNVSRYWSGHCLNLLLALAGGTIRAPKFTTRVVTGLPVQSWSVENAERVAASFMGVHKFKLNNESREITVDGVFVMMEGAGALVAHGSDEAVPQGVIDIGGQTTDLFWAEGMDPVLPRCKGTSRGVEAIGDHLKQAIADKYQRDLLPQEIRKILHAHATGAALPLIHDGKREILLNGELAAAIETVANGIGSFISRTWRSGDRGRVAMEAKHVPLIGGGAYYFKPHLEKIIPHIEVPKNPEGANARGYRDLGDVLEDDAWLR